jgi:acyl carrier protein
MLGSMKRMIGYLNTDHLPVLANIEEMPASINHELTNTQPPKPNTHLTLQSKKDIENYVLSISRGYFRTTNKANLTPDSLYTEHGLDSLDVIELVIQVEDDIGIIIDAENLDLFKKPKNFINFIYQTDTYIKTTGYDPIRQGKVNKMEEGFPINKNVDSLFQKAKKLFTK